MIFRQLIDSETSTYTYVIGDPWSREAVIIDPVRENLERDLSFVRELGLKLIYSIETHCHADHITSGALLRLKTGCKLVVSRTTGVTGADIIVDDGDAIRFGLQALEVRATPGHTEGCVTLVSATMPLAFTGDTLFIRGCGRTDFQGGSAQTLYRSVRDKIFSLPDETLIYPGHDYRGRTVSSVREEKLFNPRLGGGRTEAQFVAIMDNLNLAYPRHIDVAVPANMESGRLDEDVQVEHQTEFGGGLPLIRTPTGAPNVPVVWVADNRDAIRLIDVRTHEEWNGPEGRIEGADLVPMDTVLARAQTWDKSKQFVIMCRSGGRSDRIAMELEQRGFSAVASMTGGILKWANLGLAVSGGEQG